ncbi:transcriptional regulator [Kitasatospora sp. MMS16-BH015]|uniref:ROK family transcriptional regulator n=1 Tax=Kitasatospora sp. MMS16-BH015 TaxID=2018025 RepID=UPI000CA31421|nr:ROK family transcriptional regulator [Kitasatospora sp. MMS16-BH015]AUG75205.1 transcriptional regulator [Kitasatospora sp. MMS16-BH015]
MTIARPAAPKPAGPATPSTARAINDRRALDLLVERGPLSAAELRDLTGLSRPTVADLLDRLQRSGLVAVAGESAELRRGPNARLYGIVPDRAHLAGIDIRATGVRMVVADLTGRTLATAELPAEGPDLVARTVRALGETARGAGAARLHTVAVGAPGMVHPATGRQHSDGQPGWHAELIAALRSSGGAGGAGGDGTGGIAGSGEPVLAGTRVILENEVNLAGIAEHRLGAARDRDTFALLWLGHSVGGALMLDGRLLRGVSGGTGELCYLPVPGTGALPTSTASEGGFHSLVGSEAVCELARAHGRPVPEVGLGAGLTGRPGGAAGAAGAGAAGRRGGVGLGPVARAEVVVRAALAAGPAGMPFLTHLAERIAIGAAAVCVVVDPGCVVLGGELGRAGGEVLAGLVAERLARLSPLRTEVRAGTAGGAAVLTGAVLTAGDAARRELFGG